MKNLTCTVCVKAEWIKRFAYAAMLCDNQLDTEIAMLIAERHLGEFGDAEPEAAAEIYSQRWQGSSHGDRARRSRPAGRAPDTLRLAALHQ